jgi:membrane protease YdiL (CAAX protease family)
MPWVIGIMWSPGIAAITARLLGQGNLRGLGWGWGKTRYQLVSYALPLLSCVVVYGAVWMTGLGTFSSGTYSSLVGRQFGLEAPTSLALSLLIMTTAGFLFGLVTALGEEIGWRGFLVPELYRTTSFGRTSVVVGIIWSAWHYPGILFTGYYSGDNAWYAIPCFTVMLLGLSFVMSWLRIKSGCMWTAVILHASHNMFIQGMFDPLTERTAATEYVTTEFGIGLAVVYCVAAYCCWRKRAELPGARMA